MTIKLEMYLKTRGLLRKDIKIIHVNDVKDNLDITGKVVNDDEIIDYFTTSDLQLYINTKLLLADIKTRLMPKEKENESIN